MKTMFRTSLIGKVNIEKLKVIEETKCFVLYLHPDSNLKVHEFKDSKLTRWFDNFIEAKEFIKVDCFRRINDIQNKINHVRNLEESDIPLL